MSRTASNLAARRGFRPAAHGNVYGPQPRKGVVVDEDRIEGKVKEGAGKLTGDEELEKEGQAQDSWGKAKDKADDAKDEADDAWESVDKKI